MNSLRSIPHRVVSSKQLSNSPIHFCLFLLITQHIQSPNQPSFPSSPSFPLHPVLSISPTFSTLSNHSNTLKHLIGRFMPQIRQSSQEPTPFFSSFFTILPRRIHSPCKHNAEKWKLNAMYAHRVCHQNLEPRTDPHREAGRGRHQRQ